MSDAAIKSSNYNDGLAIHIAALNLCERKDQIIIDVPAGDYANATGRNAASEKFLSFFDNPATRGLLIQATLANATNEHGAKGINMICDPDTGNITWTVYSKYNANRTPFKPLSMEGLPQIRAPHISP